MLTIRGYFIFMRLSKIGRSFFQFRQRGTNLYQEIVAGLTTFVTMSYALILVPSLLVQHGEYLDATIVATIFVAFLATFAVGWVANLPYAVAPGIAITAYIHTMAIETWHLPFATCMGAIFLAGCLLIILTLTGIRKIILLSMPKALNCALIAGIGAFLMMTGLKNAEVLQPTRYFFKIATQLTFAHSMLILGILVTMLMLRKRVVGAFFWGMLFVWFIALISGHVSMKAMVLWPPQFPEHFGFFDIKDAFQWKYVGLIISIVGVAVFEMTGALTTLEHALPLQEKRVFQRFFYCDSLGSSVAGYLGSTPVGVYLESLTGLAAGGRTGVTAIVAACCMLVTLLIVPVMASMPAYVTSAVLIVLGASLLKEIRKFHWQDPTDWIISCLVFLLIPYTMNIFSGVGIGYMTYCILKLVTGRKKDISMCSWMLSAFFLLKFLLFDRLGMMVSSLTFPTF